MVNLANLRKAVAYGQTMLSDRSLFVDKIWWTMPKLKHLKNKTFWVIYKQLALPSVACARPATLSSLRSLLSGLRLQRPLFDEKKNREKFFLSIFRIFFCRNLSYDE